MILDSANANVGAFDSPYTSQARDLPKNEMPSRYIS